MLANPEAGEKSAHMLQREIQAEHAGNIVIALDDREGDGNARFLVGEENIDIAPEE